MWCMTTRGFFSAVQHRKDPNLLLVRARCRDDIFSLVELIDATPWCDDAADYGWRIVCSKAQWLGAIAQMAADIDYPNFKGAIRDDAHHDAYTRVWAVLTSLDDRPGKTPVRIADSAWDVDDDDWDADAFIDD